MWDRQSRRRRGTGSPGADVGRTCLDVRAELACDDRFVAEVACDEAMVALLTMLGHGHSQQLDIAPGLGAHDLRGRP